MASKITRSQSIGFFLLGLFKKSVYENAPTTKLGMMDRIRRVYEAITPEVLRSVLENFKGDFDCAYKIMADILNIGFGAPE